MFDYYYARELVDGVYNVNNPLRVDGEENQILLCTEICDSSISKDCNINCFDYSVKISFLTELSGAEQATLDTVISDHKNNL